MKSRAHKAGARGLKVLKTLGLYLRENISEGRLVKIDDPRFDPMWEACGALDMPVAIHVSDPEAFFLPTDRTNERFEELNNHPDWSFHGKDFPSNSGIARSPQSSDRQAPENSIHRAPRRQQCRESSLRQRMYGSFSEHGGRNGGARRRTRPPTSQLSRKFFDKYQDRILFGTDAVPNGTDTPQQIFGDELYEIYFRFLETEDEYFDYAPAPVPPQGRWRIYGIGLPDGILKKVYYENAARLLKLKM